MLLAWKATRNCFTKEEAPPLMNLENLICCIIRNQQVNWPNLQVIRPLNQDHVTHSNSSAPCARIVHLCHHSTRYGMHDREMKLRSRNGNAGSRIGIAGIACNWKPSSTSKDFIITKRQFYRALSFELEQAGQLLRENADETDFTIANFVTALHEDYDNVA